MMIYFDRAVNDAAQTALARSRSLGYDEPDMLIFLDALLETVPYMDAVIEAAGLVPATVKETLRAHVLKTFEVTPEDYEAVSVKDVELSDIPGDDMETVLVESARHVISSGRVPPAVDALDVLVVVLSFMEIFDDEAYNKLPELRPMAFKVADRKLRAPGGALAERQMQLVAYESEMLDELGQAMKAVQNEGDNPVMPDLSEIQSAVEKMLAQVASGEAEAVPTVLAFGPDGKLQSARAVGEPGETAGGAENKHEKILARFTTELTAPEVLERLDPLVGRQAELERLFEILCCRRKNKPLILGETGTGKTALVQGLARAIAADEVPAFLKGGRIFVMQAGGLVSRYRGVFAERIGEVAAAVKALPGAILFIDDIDNLIDGTDENSHEQLNALQRLVADSDLKLIASSNYTAWRKTLSQQSAIARRLQLVELKPVTAAEAETILSGIAPTFAKYHNVVFTDDVVPEAVRLADRYVAGRALPDKAVDVLDELAAAAIVRRTDPDETVTVDASGLPHVIARMARIPVDQVAERREGELKNLGARLKATVFGQDAAIDAVVAAIKMQRSGLGSQERPVGSFLFTGPTGVGKTEVARRLAEALGVPLLRFDMSEYSEAHTVSRLIGAPAGYVGFNDGGQLTEKVTRHPYSVVLLDEIEKAHSQLFNLLLQVMDHGKLTDAAGREADFRNVVLIMTSNVGARANERNAIGFGDTTVTGEDTRALKQTFSPEFRNRFDAIVRFAPLSHESLASVVDKFLGELSAQLAERNVSAVYTPAFKAFLAAKGYDPHMGARPMKRLIADHVRHRLADELLFGRLAGGGTVTVDVADNDEVTFTFA